MTITGGTALASDDIDRMVKDAEQYADEDRQRREAAETRNQGDQLVHQTEKLLTEQAEQLSDDERTQIESALGELRSTLENQSAAADEIRSKMEAVITASQALAQRIYQQARRAAGGRGVVRPPTTRTSSKPRSSMRARRSRPDGLLHRTADGERRTAVSDE